jgi:hypothetical protein
MHYSVVMGRLYYVRTKVLLGFFVALLGIGHNSEGANLDEYIYYSVAIS